MKRILKNRGDIAVTTALMMPFILMFLFMVVDYAYMANQKMYIQRSADSATLAMVSMAVNNEPIKTDRYGVIKEGEKAGQKVGEITEDYYRHGIEQLQNDLKESQYDIQYFNDHYAYENLDDITRKQLTNGIARLKFVGYVEGFFSRFAGLNLKIRVPIDSISTCAATIVTESGD